MCYFNYNNKLSNFSKYYEYFSASRLLIVLRYAFNLSMLLLSIIRHLSLVFIHSVFDSFRTFENF
jgi:hypothetical protein